MKWNGTVSQEANRNIPPRLARENRTHATSIQWRRRAGHSTRSNHIDPVSLPAYRFDDIRPELATKPADVHVHHVRSAVEEEPPHRGQELLLRHRDAGIRHELPKEQELTFRQEDGAAARICLSFDQVEPEAADAERRGAGLRRTPK